MGAQNLQQQELVHVVHVNIPNKQKAVYYNTTNVLKFKANLCDMSECRGSALVQLEKQK